LDTGIFDLAILHKPRGSKGLWQRVENNDKLRVTKGKGKRLKLQFLLPPGFHCEPFVHGNNLKVQLLEVDASQHQSTAEAKEPDFTFEVFNNW
jgi:hypothetical protein